MSTDDFDIFTHIYLGYYDFEDFIIKLIDISEFKDPSFSPIVNPITGEEVKRIPFRGPYKTRIYYI